MHDSAVEAARSNAVGGRPERRGRTIGSRSGGIARRGGPQPDRRNTMTRSEQGRAGGWSGVWRQPGAALGVCPYIPWHTKNLGDNTNMYTHVLAHRSTTTKPTRTKSTKGTPKYGNFHPSRPSLQLLAAHVLLRVTARVASVPAPCPASGKAATCPLRCYEHPTSG